MMQRCSQFAKFSSKVSDAFSVARCGSELRVVDEGVTVAVYLLSGESIREEQSVKILIHHLMNYTEHQQPEEGPLVDP